MLLSATLSKPAANIQNTLGRNYEKIKIKAEHSALLAKEISFFVEMFTKTQVFHEHFTEKEAENFLNTHAGTSFKNCVIRSDSEITTILANKKGKITKLVKKVKDDEENFSDGLNSLNPDEEISLGASKNLFFDRKKGSRGRDRKKTYILPEGKPVPFLVLLGIMTPEGKVIASKYDKFRQINRFLEFIDDTINSLENQQKRTQNLSLNKDGQNQQEQQLPHKLTLLDFGCGKSYLTFAVHYFLTEIRHIPCKIGGLDLKEDVINYCNQICQKLNLEDISFKVGNIADYSEEKAPDLVITLHACDTATDFALEYAVKRNARAILSVPCCQHQINTQISANKPLVSNKDGLFSPLLKWGILRERFSALLTDGLRGQWLEEQGYKVQLLEFIDMEHTPKNILIRAIKNESTQERSDSKNNSKAESSILKEEKTPSIITELGIKPELWK